MAQRQQFRQFEAGCLLPFQTVKLAAIKREIRRTGDIADYIKREATSFRLTCQLTQHRIV